MIYQNLRDAFNSDSGIPSEAGFANPEAQRGWRTQRIFVRHFLMGIAGSLMISAASVFSVPLWS
jgi:hypothetical protein